MNEVCCEKQNFVRLTADRDPLTDPGTAEGVEFTLGTCGNCGRYLVSCWVGGGVAVVDKVVDQTFIERLRKASSVRAPGTPGRSEREQILATWWND